MSQLQARARLQVGALVTAASVFVGGCTSSQDETAEVATDMTTTVADDSTAAEAPADAVIFTVALVWIARPSGVSVTQ